MGTRADRKLTVEWAGGDSVSEDGQLSGGGVVILLVLTLLCGWYGGGLEGSLGVGSRSPCKMK